MVEFIKANQHLVPVKDIIDVDITFLEDQKVIVRTQTNEYICYGFDAIEAVMLLRPSALEGRLLKWKKHVWAFHNIVAHPLMQFLAFFKLYKAAIWIHDKTTPKPRDFK